MKVIAHLHCHLSQDAPEVVSSGVPEPPDPTVDRWATNKAMVKGFSTDMPWNPYKANWHNDIREQVVVMAIGSCVLATVTFARRVHHVVVVVAHIYVSCRCIQGARPCFARCAVAREC